MKRYTEKEIQVLRDKYHPSQRIILDARMDDPRPIEAGEIGTVTHVDDIGSIRVRWDNGRSLAIIPELDTFSVYPALMVLT